MGPLKSFHKFFEGVRLSAPKKLDQKSAVAPPACCGCSPWPSSDCTVRRSVLAF